MLRFTAFWAGFFALAAISAWLLANLAANLGILIHPRLLLVLSLFALITALAVLYAKTFQGFLLRYFAAKPAISISRDLNRCQATEDANVVDTVFGKRAFYEIDLSFAQRSDGHFNLPGTIAILLERSPCQFLVFERPTSPHEYSVAKGVEPDLRELMTLENKRLCTKPARGRQVMQVAVPVKGLADARYLPELAPALRPISADQFAGGFFPPSLIEQPGAIAEKTRAVSVPAIVQTGSGRYLPLIVNDVIEGYSAPSFGHQRPHELAAHLNLPVLYQAFAFDYGQSERHRLNLVAALEELFPKALLPGEAKRTMAEDEAKLKRLKKEQESSEPPKLLKQVYWIKLEDGDPAPLIADRAKRWLREKGIIATGLTPTRALRMFAGLYPGLEELTVDRSQGFGLGSGFDEVTAELNQLATWPGHERPTLVVEDEAGSTSSLDLFSGGNNYNAVIVGQSGSGKSVLINGMVAGHLAQSPHNRAIIVDYGGSFDGLVDALGGFRIAYDQLDDFRISPFPTIENPLDEAAFQEQFPGQDYTSYHREHNALTHETAKSALIFIAQYLSGEPISHNAVLEDIFLRFYRDCVKSGRGLDAILAEGLAFANQTGEPDEPVICKQARADLVTLLLELQARAAHTPYLGTGNLDLRKSRITSFNLDGFPEDDKRVMVGLINLLVQQLFGKPQAGKTLIVFDEAHMFTLNADRTVSGIGHMLVANSRMTRKHGCAQILASQEPRDYASLAGILNNAAHHIIMRLEGAELSDAWRLTKPDIINHATRTPPAEQAGYSTLHIGTATAAGNMEVIYRYRVTPVMHYLFTSKKREKLILRLALAISDQLNIVQLGAAIHRGEDRLIPIGSLRFFERLATITRDEAAPLAGELARIFAGGAGDALLDLFLNQRPKFNLLASDAKAVRRFVLNHL